MKYLLRLLQCTCFFALTGYLIWAALGGWYFEFGDNGVWYLIPIIPIMTFYNHVMKFCLGWMIDITNELTN